MLNVNIIAVGKLKENYLRMACAEYEKRLGAFCRLGIIELAESRLPEKPSEKEILSALDEEAQAMEKKLSGAYNIAMCIEGKTLSSEKFSELITRIPVQGKSTVNIIIGSSYGIADSIKSRADLRLSMSPMTFPHQLARVMVLEQLYRAFMISGGGKYHK
ncbi:MAG: 23S rRNA (pseudouridine(1915)-N(3))-methyltransferase RlmH [Oscillospiraceae bacterium]|nr:23S rRNA (pseudouridine(1915)-N(3))-methyltransferase RlmH [Oscillospiraceae bacterium]